MTRDPTLDHERRSFGLHCLGWLLPLCLLAFGVLSPQPILATPTPVLESPVLEIRNDAGGSLQARIDQIASLRQSGQHVAIRRGYCNSACTLYLGLSTTCVSPRARFGFHGPQLATKGLRMLPHDFDRWSRQMATHYPSPLRQWFMSTARHSDDLITIGGAELIRMGIPQCA